MNEAMPVGEPARPAAASVPVAELCRRFEAAWKAAAGPDPLPRIEDYLLEAPPAERGALLRELLLLELYYRERRGDTPSLEEYRLRFREYGAWVEGVLASTAGSAPGPEGARAASVQHTQPHRQAPLQGSQQAGADTPGLPGYEVIGELGRGGMGGRLPGR
jgi:hypothetical protein